MSSNLPVLSNLTVIKSIEVSGFPIEVGVLPDGTPFLSGRGLARACGISNSTLVGWGEQTPQVGDRRRAGKMADLLANYGYTGDRFFFKIPSGTCFEGKANVSVYPYQVCLAFLDYYAFEANKEAARNSLRILSEKQLPQFILEALDQTPPQPLKPQYNPFQQRPLCNGIPVGYFTVAQLAADETGRSRKIWLTLDSANLSLDIIDRAWSQYWHIKKLWAPYGDRFPLPRASNEPRREPSYIYPTAALEAFKQWFNWKYIPERFPSYLQRKIKQSAAHATFFHQLPQAG